MQALLTLKQPIADWLAERIAGKGVTQGQVATYTGVRDTTVGRWVAGRSRPTVENCHAIARYFEWPVRDVLEMAGYPTESHEPTRSPDVFAANSGDLTDEEWEKLTEYAKFIKGQRRQR